MTVCLFMAVSLCAGRVRIEPLILEGAEARRPVFAAYAKGGRRPHVGLQEMGANPAWGPHPPSACFPWQPPLLVNGALSVSCACLLREVLRLSRMQSERSVGVSTHNVGSSGFRAQA